MGTGGEGGKGFLQGGVGGRSLYNNIDGGFGGGAGTYETVEELEAEVATLVEAVGIMNMIPVAAEEDLTMLGKISKTSVAIKQLAMVR